MPCSLPMKWVSIDLKAYERNLFTGGWLESCRASGNVTAEDLIAQIRLVAEQKAFVGLVLRVDSPGVCAFAIWG